MISAGLFTQQAFGCRWPIKPGKIPAPFFGHFHCRMNCFLDYDDIGFMRGPRAFRTLRPPFAAAMYFPWTVFLYISFSLQAWYICFLLFDELIFRRLMMTLLRRALSGSFMPRRDCQLVAASVEHCRCAMDVEGGCCAIEPGDRGTRAAELPSR